MAPVKGTVPDCTYSEYSHVHTVSVLHANSIVQCTENWSHTSLFSYKTKQVYTVPLTTQCVYTCTGYQR